MKKLLLLGFLFFTGIISSFAQLTVNTTMTPQQYVENILIGTGVSVSNVNYTGGINAQRQIASFNGTNSNIGFGGGVLLSSSPATAVAPGSPFVSDAIDPLGTSDPGNGDLLAVAQSANPAINVCRDAGVLEFDFIPTSNTVNFRFVFGSDEYTTWVGSSFNDVFGFFVAGPGITGPYTAPAGFTGGSANLALVPGTTSPITISTIYPAGLMNSNTVPQGLNPEYYIQNNATTHNLNGFTIPILITFNVQCDSTYHFKFAVADCGDESLNTVVFLEENSFTSPPVNFAITGPEGSSGVTTITEGCSEPARLYFTRSLCQAINPITVNYVVSGSATEGTDYNNLVNPLQLASGEDSAYIEVTAFDDGIAEGIEYITISYSYVDENGETITTQGTVAISDPAPINVDLGADRLIKCEGQTVSVNPTVTGGGGPSYYEYAWKLNGQPLPATTSTINSGALNNGTYQYIVTVDGACNVSDSDTMLVVVNQTLKIDGITVIDAECGKSNGVVAAAVSGQTGQIAYNWNAGAGTPNFAASVYENLAPGTYFFTATDNVCSVDTSVTVGMDPPPTAEIEPTVDELCSPVTAVFVNKSENGKTYLWNLGSGFYGVNDLNNQSATYTQTTTVYLIAISGLCSDTTSYTVNVSNCGCTNPLAINFDPVATVDDGSCLIPEPVVIVPNIFTPNGDGANDFFEFDLSNVNSVEMTIIDRWGIEVFSQSAVTAKWDGKLKNGEIAADGVYFYKYKANGIDKSVEGQGFLHLVRD